MLSGDSQKKHDSKTGIEYDKNGYEKRLNENDVKNMIRHQMDKSHRNTTFMQCLKKLTQSIKTIETEKSLLLAYADFNLNDAYKVLVDSKKQPGRMI